MTAATTTAIPTRNGLHSTGTPPRQDRPLRIDERSLAGDAASPYAPRRRVSMVPGGSGHPGRRYALGPRRTVGRRRGHAIDERHGSPPSPFLIATALSLALLGLPSRSLDAQPAPDASAEAMNAELGRRACRACGAELPLPGPGDHSPPC